MIDVRELRIGNYVYLGSPDIYWGGVRINSRKQLAGDIGM